MHEIVARAALSVPPSVDDVHWWLQTFQEEMRAVHEI